MRIIGLIMFFAMAACHPWFPDRAEVKEDCIRCGYVQAYQCVHNRGYECRVILSPTRKWKDLNDDKDLWHETINSVVILDDRICRFRYRMGEDDRIDYEKVEFSDKECKENPR